MRNMMETTEKYDRQLRLWGANGQRALSQCHILLVNADAVGTETLKNLVLPGVGKFTVLDSETVTESELTKNFFVSYEDVGTSRAQATVKWLCEMNPDVSGFYRISKALEILEQEPEYFYQFSVIVAANVTIPILSKLSTICWQASIPLLVVRSYGLLGTLRIQYPELEVVETRSETDQFDLRVANPFPELLAFSQSFDTQSLDSAERAHIPWVVLLIRSLETWKQTSSGGVPPRTRADKDAFKKSIECVLGEHHSGPVPQNTVEALREAHRAYQPRHVPDSLEALLQEEKTVRLTSHSSPFRILLHAVGVFRREQGCLPLGGQLPDMTATTTFYMELQTVYHKKALADRELLVEIADGLLQSIGREKGSISAEFIELFCKNLLGLQILKTRPIALEYGWADVAEEAGAKAEETDSIAEILSESTEEPSQTPLLWYFALRAAEEFQDRTGRWPGSLDSQLDSDTSDLWEILQRIAASNGLAVAEDPSPTDGENGVLSAQVSLDFAKEIARYGGGELHAISSFMGGIAAQEAVKVIARQYVALNNTFVYNGISCRAATYRF